MSSGSRVLLGLLVLGLSLSGPSLSLCSPPSSTPDLTESLEVQAVRRLTAEYAQQLLLAISTGLMTTGIRNLQTSQHVSGTIKTLYQRRGSNSSAHR